MFCKYVFIYFIELILLIRLEHNIMVENKIKSFVLVRSLLFVRVWQTAGQRSRDFPEMLHGRYTI